MKIIRSWKHAVLTCCLPVVANAQAPDPGDVEAALRDSLSPELFGSAYAAMVSFAVSPEVSAAIFSPDASAGVIDPQLQVVKFPFRHLFGDDGDAIRPYLQGDVAYQKFESGFDIAPGEFIDTEWRTLGGALVGGLEINGGDNLVWMPTVAVGYASLENTADFTGPVMTGVVGPALEGSFFNWDANALVYGASFGADYKREFGGFDVEVRGNLAHNIVDTVGSGDIDFDGGVTTFDVDLNSVHPTGKTFRNHPLSWVALLGHTRFIGSNSDALGFESFYEAGLALDLDISSKNWRIKSVRVGLKAILGSDVDGWGLVVAYGH